MSSVSLRLNISLKDERNDPCTGFCAKTAHGPFWKNIQQRILQQCPLDKLTLALLLSVMDVTGEWRVAGLL